MATTSGRSPAAPLRAPTARNADAGPASSTVPASNGLSAPNGMFRLDSVAVSQTAVRPAARASATTSRTRRVLPTPERPAITALPRRVISVSRSARSSRRPTMSPLATAPS